MSGLYKYTVFCSGTSTGFSITALLQWINVQTISSAIAFIGSASFTVFSWYLSRRAEILRIERETAAAELAFKRQQEYLDVVASNARQMVTLLHEIKVTKAREDAGLPDADAAHLPDPGPVS